MKFEATANQIRALLRLAEATDVADESGGGGRDSLKRGIPRLLLERYSALLHAGRHPAIVAIEQGGCSGCHLRLPTMLEYKAGRSLGVYTCPHCRRMLYARALLQNQSSAAEDRPSRRETAISAAGRH